MSAGSLTCSELAEIHLKAEAVWADNAAKKDFIADVGAIEAVRAEQTAKIKEAEDGEKDYDIKVTWLKDCDETIEDATDECTVGGAEPESACKTYTLDIHKKVGFNVQEKVFRTNDYEFQQAVAVSMMRKMKLLDEYIAEQAVEVINNNAGANVFTSGSKGTVSGFNTYVSPQYWSADLISYLHLTAKKNKFLNPFMLSGVNLWEPYQQAKFNAGNASGSGDIAKFNSLRMYWDIFNVDSVLDPDKKTFMIDKGALAFHSKAYYSTTPRVYTGSGLTKYSVPSKNLPGVFYDVTYTDTCSADIITHKWSIQTKAGIFHNPVGCNINNTGILSFVCGNAPA